MKAAEAARVLRAMADMDVGEDDALLAGAAALERESECRTCGAQCEPCATDGRMIAAMGREAARPTREEVAILICDYVGWQMEPQQCDYESAADAVLALFERKGVR